MREDGIEELAQECCLQFFQDLDELMGRAHEQDAAAFVARRARWTLLDALRRRRVERRLFAEPEPEAQQIEGAQCLFGRYPLLPNERACVFAALDTEDGELLCEHAEGTTLAEVAENHGKTLSSVYRAVCRARARIAECVGVLDAPR
jgi:DNA-directed RNA polymerase specialized sigma24 family protein